MQTQFYALTVILRSESGPDKEVSVIVDASVMRPLHVPVRRVTLMRVELFVIPSTGNSENISRKYLSLLNEQRIVFKNSKITFRSLIIMTLLATRPESF